MMEADSVASLLGTCFSLPLYNHCLSLFLSDRTEYAVIWSANDTVNYIALQVSTSKIYTTRKGDISTVQRFWTCLYATILCHDCHGSVNFLFRTPSHVESIMNHTFR
jgi:hypothetical protein